MTSMTASSATATNDVVLYDGNDESGHISQCHYADDESVMKLKNKRCETKRQRNDVGETNSWFHCTTQC